MNGDRPSPCRLELERLVDAHGATLGRRDPHRWRVGTKRLLDWLETAQGETWQSRWEATGAEVMDRWTDSVGLHKDYEHYAVTAVFQALLCLRVIRPGYPWLIRQPFLSLAAQMTQTSDRCEFDRLFETARKTNVDARAVALAAMIIARLLVHTGKRMEALTTDEFLVYAVTARQAGQSRNWGLHTAHQLLRAMAIIEGPPLTPGMAKRHGPHTISELVDLRQIAYQPIRDVLVRYLTERAAGLDYASLLQLEIRLGHLFWRDLERHHPGIDSLTLAPDVTASWRERARSLPDGRPRRNLDSLFFAVRSFYLDIAQWAAEDPATWGAWVAPSPVSAADVRPFAKLLHHRRARMHARIRSLAPVLPALVRATHHRLRTATQLLSKATDAADGETFIVEGRLFRKFPLDRRSVRTFGAVPVFVKPSDEPSSRALNCAKEEEDAFWCWAIVEVLRLTGLRCEELLELTHLSIRQYRPPEGKVVLLLQIAPSKMDRERVIPVCPELAHALARIVARVRGDSRDVPLAQRWDPYEQIFSPPLPFLFQRRQNGSQCVMGWSSVVGLLDRAARYAGLCDVDGQALVFRPHDLRRIFATDAVNGGLPVHIAAKLLGHLDINTTQGYVAVYDDQVIRHVQAYVARRRAMRSSEEYRDPTPAEWTEFEQHFRRRKMALGDCYRPYGTDCPHEHACIRCPMLRMDPNQLPRLVLIEQDTHRLLDEARRKGWEGEVLGLQSTLGHIEEKRAQAERIGSTSTGQVEA